MPPPSLLVRVPSKLILCVCCLLLLFGLTTAIGSEYVRAVDCNQIAGLSSLAERCRKVGNEVYPEILLFFGQNDQAPIQFNIEFREHLKGKKGENVYGQTKGTKIFLNASWLIRSPVDLDSILVHEMVHLAQPYKARVPRHWTEGIADYVRYKLGYLEGPYCPECSATNPHYLSGYTCTGAFLLFLDQRYGSNVVLQLNATLRKNRYSDAFFSDATGKSLEMLWKEFQKSPAFTPMAAEINQLNELLGFKNGHPPKDLQARFEAYLKQHHASYEIDKIRNALGCHGGKPPEDTAARYAIYRFLDGPGSLIRQKAVAFLTSLGEKGQLPGWSKEMWYPGDLEGYPEIYPYALTIHGRKDGDPFLYHYRVDREGKDLPWKLEKAWRTGPSGGVIENYAAQQTEPK